MSYLEEKNTNLIYELNANLELMRRAIIPLNLSYEECIKIGIREDYNFDELKSFEALTARFSRASDILTQKILKTVFIIRGEDLNSFIDRANFCEKLNIIDSAEDFIAIRKTRNDITHEYIFTNLVRIFKDVLHLTPVLLEINDKIRQFIENNKINMV